MIGNHPPRRPVYGRDHAAARTPGDRERRTQARQAAEALFAQEPMATDPEVPLSPSAQAERIDAAARRDAGSRKIPTAHAARIRTWVKYGMTISQVAELYGADDAEIKRILREI